MLKELQLKINSVLAAVWTAIARFIFTTISIILLGLIEKRTLAISSGIGTGITALFFASFEFLNCQQNGNFSAFLILIYVAVITVGFMILPGVLICELFPAKIRGFAGGLSFMIFHFAMFCSTKSFTLIKQTIGIYGVFSIFGLSSILVSLFLSKDIALLKNVL